jgi:hypothetical protein
VRGALTNVLHKLGRRGRGHRQDHAGGIGGCRSRLHGHPLHIPEKIWRKMLKETPSSFKIDVEPHVSLTHPQDIDAPLHIAAQRNVNQ